MNQQQPGKTPNHHQSEESSPRNRRMKPNRRHLGQIREPQQPEQQPAGRSRQPARWAISVLFSCAWQRCGAAHTACRTAGRSDMYGKICRTRACTCPEQSACKFHGRTRPRLPKPGPKGRRRASWWNQWGRLSERPWACHRSGVSRRSGPRSAAGGVTERRCRNGTGPGTQDRRKHVACRHLTGPAIAAQTAFSAARAS